MNMLTGGRRAAVSVLMAVGVIVSVDAGATTGTVAGLSDPSLGAKPCAIEDLERPSVLVTRDRIEKLRGEIARPGRKRDYYDDVLKKNADRWMARTITIPERAGHYHHFVCEDGTRFPVPDDQQFDASGTYTCPTCGKQHTGEKVDGGRRNYEHLWLMAAARDLALVSVLEDNRKAAEKAAEILRKYADAYPGRHTSATEGGIYYQSLDESMHIIPLAQAYDLIYDSGVLSDAEKAHIERDLFWESAAGLMACGARTNWGSWHLSAVGVIGVATRHQAMIDYGVEKFRAQIRDELGDDGLWPESVHTYHFFPLNAFISLAEATTNAGTDLWNWEAKPGKGLKRMFTAPLRYMYPDGRLPAINDGWFASFLPLDQYELAYSRFRDPELAWAVGDRRQGKGGSAGSAVEERLWSFLVGEELPEEMDRPAFPSTDFPVLGICTLRTGGSPENETMLTFDYGRHLGHGQLDKMGITLYSGGKLLAADYGTPSYGSSILPYYTGTSSHNTIAVDGQNQQRSATAQLLTFEDTALMKVASARADDVYPGVEWRRTVLLTDEYVLVVDDLSSSESRTYDWLFRCEGDGLELENTAGAGSDGSLPYGHFEDVKSYGAPLKSEKGYTARWRTGSQEELALVSAGGPEAVVFAAKCPSDSIARMIPVLVQRQSGKTARFVVALRPGHIKSGGGPELLVAEGGEITVRCGTTTDRVAIGDRSISLERSAEAAQPERVEVALRASE